MFNKFVFKIPDPLIVAAAVLLSLLQVYVLYLWLGGKARCPNCGKPPVASSGLAFGVSPFISRCSRCDYPLCLPELEKDLAEKNAVLNGVL